MKEIFVIEDVETLKALAHPQRLEIMRHLKESRTVKEVAERLDADPTKLYYHVRQLENAGLIEVTETNIISGIIEKQYRAIAKSFRVLDKLITGESFAADDFDRLAQAMFNSTLYSLRESLNAGLIAPTGVGIKRSHALLTHHARLTEAQVEEFGERLQTLMKDIDRWSMENAAETTPIYSVTMAFFPLPDGFLD